MDRVYILITCVLMCSYEFISEAKVYQIDVCDNNDDKNTTNNSIFHKLNETEFELPLELRPDRLFSPNIILSYHPTKIKLNCSMKSFIVTWTKGLENITNADGRRIKMPDLIISPTGYIRYKNQVYEENQYCLLNHNETQVQFEVCNKSCNEKNPCVYKCCEPDEIMDIQKFPRSACIRSKKDRWRPILFSSENIQLSSADLQSIKPILNVRHPKEFKNSECKHLETLTLQNIGNHKRTMFRILQNGSTLELDEKKQWKVLPNELFCVDGSHNFSVHRNYTSGNEHIDSILIRCYQKDPEIINLEKKKQFVDIFYGIVLVICSSFLLATLVVYIILWKNHNVHVLTQLCYIFSLLCAYIFLAATRFTSVFWTRTNVVSNSCRFIGIFAHFFYLSTFTWLSVVNLDIWLTFRNLKPISGKKGGLKKLIFYGIFAEGVPFVIVSVAFILDTVYEDDIENTIILPQYGKKNCFLDLHFAQLYYLYIPIGVLLTANIIFFTLTIYSLYFIQQSTKFATTSSSKSNSQSESLRLFTKIFLIMGIPWIFDVVSWLTTTDYHDAKWYWVIADILLFCQSFAFFSFFVLKKDICNSLDKKFPAFKNFKDQIGRLMPNAFLPFLRFTKFSCFSKKEELSSEPNTTAMTDDHANSNSKNSTSVQETGLNDPKTN